MQTQSLGIQPFHVSAVQPIELRDGMEGEHTQETDLIRRHQDLEEGERFENYRVFELIKDID